MPQDVTSMATLINTKRKRLEKEAKKDLTKYVDMLIREEGLNVSLPSSDPHSSIFDISLVSGTEAYIVGGEHHDLKMNKAGLGDLIAELQNMHDCMLDE